MTTRLPPTEFSNAMHEIDRAVSLDTWRDAPEWQIYKAGYNAAVVEANAQVLAMHDIPAVAKRCFPEDL